jgi:hypothetical protein
MRFSSLASTATVLLTLLSPTEASPSERLATRDIGHGKTTCVGTNDILFSDYRLFIDGNKQVDAGLGTKASDCGHGFLDNLHGQCGLGILKWYCERRDGGFAIAFRAPETCSTSNVQNAIWLATNPHMDGVSCTDTVPENLIKTVEEVMKLLLKVVTSWGK